ncbi:MAG: sulfotransferase [Phycisphaerales bacterium]|nr:sulfotransferase [Phycisphaerales bacterium]
MTAASSIAPRTPGLRLRAYRAWRELRYQLRAALARPHAAPVFILGAQKSGTSAIAALLGKATGLATTLDLHRELRRPTFQGIPSGDLSFERFIGLNRVDFSRPIIKEPNLTLFFDELRQRFPAARFAFVVRDPRDHIRSLLNRLKIPGDLPNLDLRGYSEVTPAWELVLDSAWAGIAGEHYIDRLAYRWRRMAETYLTHVNLFSPCRYEDFRADKVGAIHRLAAELGLDATHDIRGDVDRPFERVGDHVVTPEAFFGSNLERIVTICRDGMAAFRYDA